jgi:hypothetical protein
MKRLIALLPLLLACSAPVRMVAPPPPPVSAPAPVPPTVQIPPQKLVIQAELVRLAPQMALLSDWETAGDAPAALVPEIAAFAAQLPEFATLETACRTAPPQLVDPYDADSLAVPCALALRARDLTETQYLLAAKRAVRFPENLRDAAKRYLRQGRVAWQTLLIFQRLEADMAERTAWLQPVAHQLGLPVLGELFHEGFAARRDLRQAMRQSRNAFALPGDVTDAAFVREITPYVLLTAPDGPMPGQRGQLLQVRPIDVAWSVRLLDGLPVRRERRLAALWRPVRGPCLLTWLQATQLVQGRKWQAPTLWLEDDLRLVRCPQR